MPAPISFAFPDAMAASSIAPAGAGTSAADGAAIFGQLVNGGQAQAGQAAGALSDAVTPSLDMTQAVPLMTLAGHAAMPDKAQGLGLADDLSALMPDGDGVAADAAPAPVPAPIPAPAAAPHKALPADGMAAAKDALLTSRPAQQAQAMDALVVPVDGAAEDAALIADLDEDLTPRSDADASAPAWAAAPADPLRPQAVVAALPSIAQPAEPAAAEGEAAEDGDAPMPLPSAPISRAVDGRLAAATVQPDRMMGDDSAAASSPNNANSANSANSAPTPPVMARAEAAEPTLPAALLTQSMASGPSAAPANPYAATMAAAAAAPPVVQAKAGQMGADMGAEIAKVLQGEGDSLLIRLDPRELGRVDVRLSFDKEGILRAVMSVDSPAALEMLRRESGDLNRALTDAGVRSDSQSLRFDARSGEGMGQGAQPWRDARTGAGRMGGEQDGLSDDNMGHYRPLRTTTQVDLIA